LRFSEKGVGKNEVSRCSNPNYGSPRKSSPWGFPGFRYFTGKPPFTQLPAHSRRWRSARGTSFDEGNASVRLCLLFCFYKVPQLCAELCNVREKQTQGLTLTLRCRWLLNLSLILLFLHSFLGASGCRTASLTRPEAGAEFGALSSLGTAVKGAALPQRRRDSRRVSRAQPGRGLHARGPERGIPPSCSPLPRSG
jgi:hypothetical protein